jgi:hypothetical protein
MRIFAVGGCGTTALGPCQTPFALTLRGCSSLAPGDAVRHHSVVARPALDLGCWDRLGAVGAGFICHGRSLARSRPGTGSVLAERMTRSGMRVPQRTLASTEGSKVPRAGLEPAAFRLGGGRSFHAELPGQQGGLSRFQDSSLSETTPAFWPRFAFGWNRRNPSSKVMLRRLLGRPPSSDQIRCPRPRPCNRLRP